MKHARLVIPAVVTALCVSGMLGCNPFAPKLDESLSNAQFGDPRTIDGFFEAFRYGYQFRDTTLYGSLLDPTFIFSYRNYDRGVDVEWGREDEMRTTGLLFQYAQLDLVWGGYLDSSGGTKSFDATRTFSLNVTLSGGEIEHVDGRAIFHLVRDAPGSPWKATHWRDESNL